ncbi:MAG: preprotein translocase subunit SecG [Burkholderiales bacterium]|jgi:preprotein translocase subunit SecG|nr:preprotein translocase subunit SecG [Burkholderiales bacterium]
MDFLFSFLIAIHILVAVAVCVFVLLQHGKGADMGAAFGGGASGSIFGAAGSANFLSRTTAALVTVFFITSLGLTYYSTKQISAISDGGVMERAVQQQQTVPTTTSTPADVPQLPETENAPPANATPAETTTESAPPVNETNAASSDMATTTGKTAKETPAHQ